MIDDAGSRTDLPTGTVTFLRTDVEGSMALVRALGSGWDRANDLHLGLLRAAVERHGGVVVRTEGDALFAAFPEAGAAVTAAIDAQRAVLDHAWDVEGGLHVRMAVHTGEAHLAGADYGGFEVNRVARIATAGHGGQTILSATTSALVADALPADVTLRDLGEHALKDVPRPERLFQLDVPGLRTSFPPLRTERPAAGNLPTRLTTFLGRDAELLEAAALLHDTRLVTLTGPGGIGKTSLATEVARGEAGRYRDGAWFVPLDALSEADQVMSHIARTVGLFDGPERSAATGLLPYLEGRSMLFVLDNFEHLLDAASNVTALLRASPETRVIATSRAPLRIPGEQEYPVRPLAGLDSEGTTEPGADGAAHDAAVRLFVDRAKAVRPDWRPDGQVAVVREICRSLDGLPLGIELAAARVSLLPATAIRDRLAARLPLPGAAPRDVPSRQRTLEGAIAWSYDMLSPTDQGLLDQLAVFDGSFDSDQAALVAGSDGNPRVDALDGLMSLAEQSLIVRDPDPRAEAMLGNASGIRSRLLKTIETFALGRLAASGKEEAVRRQHALAFLALAEAAAPNLPGPDQPRWIDRLALDHANLRAAMRWAIDAGEADIALRFLPALWRFWQVDGHLVEGRALADAALTMPGADAPTAIRMVAVAAGGNIAYWQADPPTAQRHYEEQLRLALLLEDPVAEADAFFNLGHATFAAGGDPVQVAAFVDDAVARFEAIGDARGVARCELSRATILITQGRIDEATETFRPLPQRFDELGDVQYQALSLSGMAWAAYAAGDLKAASRLAIEGIIATYQMRDVGSTTIAIQEGILIAMIVERPDAAALLLGAFDGLCERYGVKPPAALQGFFDGPDPISLVRAALGAEETQRLMEVGRRRTLGEAVALIVELGDSPMLLPD